MALTTRVLRERTPRASPTDLSCSNLTFPASHEMPAALTEMKVTHEEMKAARVPLNFRDYCAHILIPLNECRVKTWYSPWKCGELRHSYEKCQYDEYQRRVTIAKGLSGGGGDDE